MTTSGPPGEQAQQTPDEQPPPPASAVERANRMSAANMIRSLLPLVVICLLAVGWIAFRQGDGDPVRPIDPSSTVQLASARASYAVPVPTGLPDGYRSTSARTDAGDAVEGAPVTLEIGYVTPSTEYAGFVVSDDPEADPLTAVLEGAEADGSVQLSGEEWTRSTSTRGETVLSREDAGVTVLVTGSADDEELETVAASVAPVATG
ncbi:hypothetical protein JOD57_003317 [Geodermatophilus bullaregiensis]|uniref:DUF4245 domain-containing protein n=1 Tax=Geodermatophilus bullaregiensis TaxID=1564160 RepID=UPI0027DC175F|nr:DUF4245 domain-containing protein [Geodermatophilus bullaregiensis]MBM7807480.1 hypothetical protein [Geodermatophilus bullaregiensis]